MSSAYSAFAPGYIRWTALTASFLGLVSPLSSTIFFPCLRPLARDLDVSVSMINLTVMSYQIFQGLAPTIVGALSDEYGRRLGYYICFVVFIGANIGLSLQNSYAALFVLRCLQSCGSSGTIALASAIVSDLATRSERGKYMAYATMGTMVGPALGPVIGGLLAQSLGWRSVFWFLTIYSGAAFVLMLCGLPETCRNVVDDGSVFPKKWYLSSITTALHRRSLEKRGIPVCTEIESAKGERKRFVLFSSLQVARDPECAAVLLYGAFMAAGYFGILTSMPDLLADNYGYDSLQQGLCYIPIGVGSFASRYLNGIFVDRNFKRICKLHGVDLKQNVQPDIAKIPVEQARLQVALPFCGLSIIFVLLYGWFMYLKLHIASIVVVLFFSGMFISFNISVVNVLIIDINRQSPAAAGAAYNLFRCLLSAASSSASVPMVNSIGVGWAGTVFAALMVIAVLLQIAVLRYGYSYRMKKADREAARVSKEPSVS